MDKMENGLGEDGGEWGRRNVANQMCNCGLWLNLIFFRDRLIRKVNSLPVDVRFVHLNTNIRGVCNENIVELMSMQISCVLDSFLQFCTNVLSNAGWFTCVLHLKSTETF